MPTARRSSVAVRLAGWMFGSAMLAVGAANLLLVHPVPALGYLVVSLVYLPPVGAVVRRRFGVVIHPIVKLALAVAIVLFTLGVSDLGEMVD